MLQQVPFPTYVKHKRMYPFTTHDTKRLRSDHRFLMIHMLKDRIQSPLLGYLYSRKSYNSCSQISAKRFSPVFITFFQYFDLLQLNKKKVNKLLPFRFKVYLCHSFKCSFFFESSLPHTIWVERPSTANGLSRDSPLYEYSPPSTPRGNNKATCKLKSIHDNYLSADHRSSKKLLQPSPIPRQGGALCCTCLL